MAKLSLNMWSVAAILALISGSTNGWSYPDLEAGEKDFPKWGGLCDSGKQQSPINLRLQDSIKAQFTPLKFVNYDKQQKGVTVVNNGHTIQLGNFPLQMQLSQGPLQKNNYILEQIHFHWNSEHTVENVRYALEAHVVHRNSLYADITEAAGHKDGIVVVAALFNIAPTPNSALQRIIDTLPSVSNFSDVNNPVAMSAPFQINSLFPSITGYFTYFGSLTTPACNEAVTWIVLQNSFPISMDQLESFKSIEHEEHKPLKNNYRFIQSTNNRAVMSVQMLASKSRRASLLRPVLSLLSL